MRRARLAIFDKLFAAAKAIVAQLAKVFDDHQAELAALDEPEAAAAMAEDEPGGEAGEAAAAPTAAANDSGAEVEGAPVAQGPRRGRSAQRSRRFSPYGGAPDAYGAAAQG